MLETIERLLSSEQPLSAIFYWVVGAIMGALISIYLTVKAQRPKLTINGGGSGGDQLRQSWNIGISNRPSFLGIPFNGETAHDVYAHVMLKRKGAPSYLLYWSGPQREQRTTIVPGERVLLDIFSWFPGTRGYCVLDHAGDPVARFESRELKFLLRLNDRLGRATEFPFTVQFDDTHLKNTPQLHISYPLSALIRWNMAKDAMRQLLLALGFRQ